MEQPKKSNSPLITVGLVVFVFVGLIWVCNKNDESDEIKTNEISSTEPAPVLKQDPYADSMVNTAPIRAVMSDTYTRAKERVAFAFIAAEADELNAAGNALWYVKDKNQAEKLRSQLIKFQKQEFPLLRAQYIKASADRMWEENVKVKSYEERHTDITFVGGSFANHAVIKKSEEAIEDMLIKLRFKKVTWKWYDYDDEPTTYSLNSKNDDDL